MLNVPEKGGRTTFDIILRPPFYKSINQAYEVTFTACCGDQFTLSFFMR